jgi:hypothetical protein
MSHDIISPVRPGTDDTPDRIDKAAGYRDDWSDDRPAYTETKVFFRTSEFWFVVIGVIAVLLAAYAEARDSLSRYDGWRYATFLVVAYAISRGLAKAGTKQPSD